MHCICSSSIGVRHREKVKWQKSMRRVCLALNKQYNGKNVIRTKKNLFTAQRLKNSWRKSTLCAAEVEATQRAHHFDARPTDGIALLMCVYITKASISFLCHQILCFYYIYLRRVGLNKSYYWYMSHSALTYM